MSNDLCEINKGHVFTDFTGLPLCPVLSQTPSTVADLGSVGGLSFILFILHSTALFVSSSGEFT